MNMKVRLLLCALAVVLAMVLGWFGANVGPLLPWYVWALGTATLAFLLLPWGRLYFSQEQLLQELRELSVALETAANLRTEIDAIHDDIEEEGVLNQERLDHYIQRFLAAREINPTHRQSLREYFFSMYRRALAMQLMLVLVGALGGALLVVSLFR